MQLEEKSSGSHWELNPGTPALYLAAGALATELWLPTATPTLRVIDNPIPKLMLKESTRIIKSPSIEHQHQ